MKDETIGDRLQIALGIRGISQTDFAEKVGITAPYVSMICNNVKNPSKPLIARICNTLSISKEWFLTGEGRMEDTEDELTDVAVITSELLNADPRSLRRIFAMTLAMLTEGQLQTIADVIGEFEKQKKKATS